VIEGLEVVVILVIEFVDNGRSVSVESAILMNFMASQERNISLYA
jgi:hypothetical protein